MDATVAGRARAALRDLERVEGGIIARRDSLDKEGRSAQRRLLDVARALLDTAILQARDGRTTLGALQREYPGAALLREYEAQRLLADGEPLRALGLFDGLLRAQRRNVPLLRGRARALDALRREPDATDAWQRLLDGYPTDVEAFEALWHRHQRASTMGELHKTVMRLRLLHPADTVLLGREVRVLQQMGLADSAVAVVRRFTGGGA
ncbi:MAG: hypothetical protein K2R93_09970 [Gemmatimonadaceae bacterium]|nr:hypothetical protein [Gemmatimonadaceae bacterium]